MIKKLIILCVIIYSSNIFANPSPLGITLNKDTLDDVRKTYRIIQSSKNATDGYHNGRLDLKDINIKTISEVTVISNDNQIVEGVILELSKHQFHEIYEAISSKYKLLKSDIPYVGDKFVKFEDDECYIMIDAPHLDFTMQVSYVTKRLVDKHYDRIKKEEQDKEEQTKKMF